MTKIYPPKYLETGTVNGEPTFPQGYEIVEIEADDSSYYQDSYQNSTFIELHFKMDHYYDFKKYSRLEHHLHIKVGLGGSLGSKENIITLEDPTFIKYSDTHYEYTLKFYNAWRERYKRKFVKDPQTKSVTFSLTGTELQHLECIIRSVVDFDIGGDNDMKIYLGQYTGQASNYGIIFNATPFWQASSALKTISYDSMTCADALEQLSELYGHAYNYNFELKEIPHQVINGESVPYVRENGTSGIRLYSDTAENNTALMYGKNNGLKSIKATGAQDIVGVLYVVGSDKNIITYAPNNYNSATLHMPKSESHNIDGAAKQCRAILLYNGVNFLPASGVYRQYYDQYSVPDGYLEYVASFQGTSVMKLNTISGFEREETASFPDVYPSRVGTVTAVTVDNNGIYSVFDSSNNIDYIALSEQTLMIIFQDGAVAGIDFELRIGPSTDYIFSTYNNPNNTTTSVYSEPYTLTKIAKSFNLNTDGSVRLKFTPYFEISPRREFGDDYSVSSAKCYLKKGNTTINSWNIGYHYDTMVSNTPGHNGSWPEGIISNFATDDSDIDITMNLTSGSYDIVIEVVFDFDQSFLNYYTLYNRAYIRGTAQISNDYNFAIVPKNIGEETLPNSTLHPAVGDHYVIVNCELPTSYVTEAEINLFKEAVKQLAEYQEDGTTYSVDCDGIFMNNHDTINRGLSSGLCVKIQDSSFMSPARTFRILNVKRPYNNENSPTIEISNVRRKKSRIDGFTHSIIDLGVAIADNFERISANNAKLKNVKRELQSSINGVDFNMSNLELDQEDIKDAQAQMEKRIGNNEYQIQELWKAIK